MATRVRRGLLWSLWRQLRGGDTSRGRASASIAVGLFIGCLPLYGLHLPLCLAICLPLKLDAVTAYIAANISNPLMAPFLLAAEIETGSLLLDGRFVDLDLDKLDAGEVSGLAAELGLGSVVVGGLLAALGALATWALLTPRRRAERTELELATQRTIARYADVPRGDRFYVASKLNADPVLEQIAALEGSFGHVVDAACGRGQLSLCLLELGRVRSLSGFDADERKVRVAEQAAAGAARFEVGDLQSGSLAGADTLLLIDVLHYLSESEQAELLARAASSIEPAGRILVRELDAGRGVRAWPAMLAEKIARLTGYNRGRTLAFSRTEDLVRQLESHGLRCRLDVSGGLSNVLIVAERPLTAS